MSLELDRSLELPKILKLCEEVPFVKLLKRFIVISVCLNLVFGIVSISFSQEKYQLGQYPDISEYQKATGEKISDFSEAPQLAELVEQGKLPPVEERLPQEPAVVEPVEEIGEYGGTWRRAAISKETATSPRMRYEPLVRWARDAKTIIPNVAHSWKITEDGTTYTFYLRKGMKWSDGEPFTADDIMFWYEDVLLNKDLTPSFPEWLTVGGSPVKVERIDDYTVKFQFTHPYSLFLEYLAGPSGPPLCQYPKHYLKQFHPAYTPVEILDKLTKEAGFQYWYELFGDRTDAYSNPDLPGISAWIPKARPGAAQVISERNPYYWKVDPEGNQLPYIDRIAFDMIQDMQMVVMKAVQGELDMQGGGVDFALSDYPLLMENREKGDYQVYLWDPNETGSALFLNQNYTEDKVIADLLRDVKFRKALSLAINRDEVNQLFYLGMATPTYTIFPFELLQNNPEIRELYEYNTTEANSILDSIGLDKRDKDGFRLRPDGTILQLTILSNTGFAIHHDVMPVIAQYWSKVGVKTEVDAVTDTLWWPRITSADYQIAGYTMGTVYPGKILLSYPTSIIPTSTSCYYAPLWGLWYSSGGEAKGSVKPTGDALTIITNYDRIKTLTDQEKIDRLTEEILYLWAKNLWTIPVCGFPKFPVVVKNNFKNVPQDGSVAYPYCSPGYLNPEQFFIKK